MRIRAGELELEVARGATIEEVVAFARGRGQPLPDRPWCGPVRLTAGHRAGDSPFTAWSALSSAPGPDAQAQPGAHLAVVAGPDAGAVATVCEHLVIGREAGAALAVDDPTLSQRHAAIDGGRVRDLGSRNGVRLNGSRLRGSRRLHDGDVLQLGDTVIAVRGGPERPARRDAVPTLGLASGGLAALSMAAFAIMSGHWQLAMVALALPAAAALGPVSRRRADPPLVAIDVTGIVDGALPPGPVAVSGPRGLVRAVTLAAGRPPRGAAHWEAWMDILPPAPSDVLWLAPGEEPPSWAAVRVSGERASLTVAAHGDTIAAPLPLVSAVLADACARRRAARAEHSHVPRGVRWAQLPPPGGQLGVRLGMGVAGPVTLDLVDDGPHVLVAGTTGSGKSEALRTIIGSLAHDYSPRRVAFALIDFKGGAGLGPCACLPHVASVLTDLEPHLARRALLALAAELADRKAAMARAGATTFSEWRDAPPRLVVVVDEFQEIAAADRDFLPQLGRLAAQGRSLGIHLVLATQRPAGAVGAQIRANISATLALRTASDAESRDLVGSGAAAAIPPDVPGRAVLQRGSELVEVQVALPLADPPPAICVVGEPQPVGRSLVAAAGVRYQGHRAAPLWLAELPARIGAATGAAIGVADVPRERKRAPLTWDPAAGPLVVTGPPRSGRSTALRAACAMVAARGAIPVAVPRDPRLAVRTLALALERPDVMLAVDDAAVTLAAACQADPEAMDLLLDAMQRMPVALAVPPAWANHRLTGSASLRVVLTGLSPEDEAAWSVPQDVRGIAHRPGRAVVGDAEGWREAQICEAQLGAAQPSEPRAPALALPLPLALEPGTSLPRDAIGIGGDTPAPVRLPRGATAVIGPPGPERDAVARRVGLATGAQPIVAENPFALGIGQPAPRTAVVVRPTARSLRDVARDAPRGMIDPAPIPLRAVVVIDGTATAVQVLPG